MEIVSRSFKTIEEIEAPEILYKYRNFTNENHFKILTENEIFFSPPTSFEDKVDCKIPIRYDLLSNQEIFEKYLSDSKDRNIGFTRQQHRNWAREWTKKSPLKDKARLKKYTEQELLRLPTWTGRGFDRPPLRKHQRCVSCPWTDSNVAHCLAAHPNTQTKASQ